MEKKLIYLILSLAALIRLFNLNHGLPDIYEEATPMRQALEMWRGSDGGLDLNPHFFNYPALYFYLQFLGQGIYFFINLLFERIHTLDHLFQSYESDPTEIILLARAINVLFSLACIWATYRLGRLFHTHQTGLLAATLLAFMPISVHTSRIILVDIPLLFFGTLSLAQSIQVFRHNTVSHHVWAGIWIGLATASKYTGALFVIPLLTAHLLHAHPIQSLWQNKNKIAAGCLLAALTFLITNPYIILDHQAFWTDFSFERTHMAVGHFGIDTTRTPLTYLQDLWYNLGILLTPILLWGLVHICKHAKTNLHQIPILAFMGLYLTLISTWSMSAAHYLLPALPPLTIATAIGFQNILQRFKYPIYITIPIALLLITPTSYHTIQSLTDNAKPDTRAQAKEWIIQNLPSGAIIAQEFYTPDLSPQTYHLLRLPMDAVRPELIAPFYNIKWYTNFDYIITSEGVSARYQKQPEKFVPQIQFYKTLQKEWQQIASFSGTNFSGPAIHIFKRIGQHNPESLYTPQQYNTLIGTNNHVASDLLKSLAIIFTQKEWYTKAIDLYRHHHTITPPQTETLTQLGLLFYQTDQIESALQAWQQALEITPQNIALLTNVGAIYHQQGHTQKAIHYWEQGLAHAPADPELLNNLIFIYRQTGHIDRAIFTVQNALKIQPNNTALQSTLKELQAHKKTPVN